MLTLNHQQANEIVSYLQRDNLPIAASFESTDDATFIWESLVWLVDAIKGRKNPSVLQSRASVMPAEEFIALVAKLAGVILTQPEEEVAETDMPEIIEKASISTLQSTVRILGDLPSNTTLSQDRNTLWENIKSAVEELTEEGYGERYTMTRGWLSQQSYEDAIFYVLRKLV